VAGKDRAGYLTAVFTLAVQTDTLTDMKRAVYAVTALVLGFGGALAVASQASADTQDFTITSFTADYFLGRDSGGHSTLRTVETIVAEFPQFDQNHGPLRDLIDDYDGHPTNIHVDSVTDGNGRAVTWDSESSDNVLELKIGDSDRYVHGTQTYVISYTSHNVTRFFGDTGDDEFYWDTNGVDWPQSFGTVTARVHVAGSLIKSLTGKTACYRGSEGSRDPCDSQATVSEGSGALYTATAEGLTGYQNLTIAIGFEKGTFVARDNSAWASPYFLVEIFAAALAILVAIYMLVKRATTFADAPGRPTIIAEYLEPKGVSPLMAGIATGRKKRAVAAQLISLAIRHAIRIIEAPASGFFATKPVYKIELLTADSLEGEELELAQIFFGYALVPGTQYQMKRTDAALGQKVFRLIQRLDSATVSRGYRKKIPLGSRFLPILIALGSAIGAIVIVFVMLDDERGGIFPFLVFIPSAIAALIVFRIAARRPYTAQGAELRDYLRGLLLYIRVAETERIRILQSPQGAERVPVDTTDRGVMLKLYERVLPFAVLFDEEKRWSKELGDYYDQQPPDWYSGSTAFSTVGFAASIGSISSLSSSSFSGSSSSSGGSGGGGSSGGGGGGGGGGGW
jgi:uncharacterized membrane protein YgcG